MSVWKVLDVAGVEHIMCGNRLGAVNDAGAA